MITFTLDRTFQYRIDIKFPSQCRWLKILSGIAPNRARRSNSELSQITQASYEGIGKAELKIFTLRRFFTYVCKRQNRDLFGPVISENRRIISRAKKRKIKDRRNYQYRDQRQNVQPISTRRKPRKQTVFPAFGLLDDEL